MDAADHAPAALRLHHHADGHLPGAGGVGNLKIAYADVRHVFDMQAVGDAGAGGGAGIALSADDEIRFGHAVGMDDGPGARLRAHGIAVVHIHHNGACPAAGASEGEALPLKDRARLQQHPVARLEGEGVDLAQGLPGRVGAGALAAVVAALGVHVEGGAGGVGVVSAHRNRGGGHRKGGLHSHGVCKGHIRVAGPAGKGHAFGRRIGGNGHGIAGHCRLRLGSTAGDGNRIGLFLTDFHRERGKAGDLPFRVHLNDIQITAIIPGQVVPGDKQRIVLCGLTFANCGCRGRRCLRGAVVLRTGLSLPYGKADVIAVQKFRIWVLPCRSLGLGYIRVSQGQALLCPLCLCELKRIVARRGGARGVQSNPRRRSGVLAAGFAPGPECIFRTRNQWKHTSLKAVAGYFQSLFTLCDIV